MPATTLTGVSIIRSCLRNEDWQVLDRQAPSVEMGVQAAARSPEVAANGQEAVATAAATAYDLILMNIQMPLMSGIEATRAIRSLDGRESLPIIAFTADAFDDKRLASRTTSSPSR